MWGLLPLGFSYDPSPPFGTDPRPFVAMMIAGFVIGVFGHITRVKSARPPAPAALRGQRLIEGRESRRARVPGDIHRAQPCLGSSAAPRRQRQAEKPR